LAQLSGTRSGKRPRQATVWCAIPYWGSSLPRRARRHNTGPRNVSTS